MTGKKVKVKSKDKRTHRRTVSVRLLPYEFEMVEKASKVMNISKSEMLRDALHGELSKMKIPDVPKEIIVQAKVLSEAERKQMIEGVGKLLTDVSKMKGDNARLDGNVNQIAKALNKGNKGISVPEASAYYGYQKEMKEGLAAVAKELNILWRQLV